jgi:hypothetical protein
MMGMEEEQFAKLAQSVFIMIPTRGTIASDLALMFGHWARFGTTITAVKDQQAGFIELVRANMCDLFRRVRHDRPELKFLVMIDDDEAVPWDAPYRLAAWNEPIVSGLICSHEDHRGIFANIFVEDEYKIARMPSFNRTQKIPGRGLKECASVGTGLICIRHDVIDGIIEAGGKPFMLSEKDRDACFDTGVLKMGEDTTFCAQAKKLGFQTYVDFGVRGKHFKTIAVQWPQSHVDYSLDVRDWKVDSKDYFHG